MKEDPTLVEFNTESVEGPVSVKVDGMAVLKIDLKARPGLLHLVLPQRYRLKEVPHTSPEIDEGVHYAVLHNSTYLENQRLEGALHTAQEEAQRFKHLANAYAQGLPGDMEISQSTPILLEVWDDEASKWKPIPWRELVAGMRFRNLDPLTGEYHCDSEGHMNWLANEDAEWVDGNWKVDCNPCETNYIQRDQSGKIIESSPSVPDSEE